jgi:hypothetical protein
MPFGRQAALTGGQFVAAGLPDGTYHVTVPVRPVPVRVTVVIDGRDPRPLTIVVGSAR